MTKRAAQCHYRGPRAIIRLEDQAGEQVVRGACVRTQVVEQIALEIGHTRNGAETRDHPALLREQSVQIEAPDEVGVDSGLDLAGQRASGRARSTAGRKVERR